LLEDVERNGYTGIGRPEALKYELTGWWSREIDEKNRLIYRVDNGVIIILACRSHYGNK
jgi:toxin YoeB